MATESVTKSVPSHQTPTRVKDDAPRYRGMSQKVFVLTVVGNSMEDPRGKTTFIGQSFPDGCGIYVEPDAPPASGRPVIVRLGAAEKPILRIYQEVDGRKLLFSPNPDYPPIEINEDTVFCGTVIARDIPENETPVDQA